MPRRSSGPRRCEPHCVTWDEINLQAIWGNLNRDGRGTLRCEFRSHRDGRDCDALISVCAVALQPAGVLRPGD